MPHPTFSLVVSLAAVLACARGVARAQEESPDLAQARTVYEKEVEFSTRPIRDRYLSRLNTLKRTLGARGDARGAAAVQDEMDRIAASVPDAGMLRFAGVWKITYPSGETKRYVISADGAVTCDENMGKRITPQKSKLTLRGSDIIMDFKNGAIERLKLSGKNLSIEHFNPKEHYPDGQPLALAVGTLISGRKE